MPRSGSGRRSQGHHYPRPGLCCDFALLRSRSHARAEGVSKSACPRQAPPASCRFQASAQASAVPMNPATRAERNRRPGGLAVGERALSPASRAFGSSGSVSTNLICDDAALETALETQAAMDHYQSGAGIQRRVGRFPRTGGEGNSHMYQHCARTEPYDRCGTRRNRRTAKTRRDFERSMEAANALWRGAG